MREDDEVKRTWVASVPVLHSFSKAADPASYLPLPGDWFIGLSDVVGSTAAIGAGRYKAVNLAGAGTISAVANALGGALPLFAFGGDGAHFALSPDQEPVAADALARASAWAERDLGLSLRVGITRVADVRAAGLDVCAAFWQASDHVRYAMFAGGGLEWAEAQLKSGAIVLPPAPEGAEPDLSGLSCQWGPIQSSQGAIMSLIVKPAPETPQAVFAGIAAGVIAILEESPALNPVPGRGPEVRWPSGAIGLQSRVADKGRSTWQRRVSVVAGAGLAWLVFKLGRRVGSFDPKRYRREIAANTDYRKFADGLMMTVDCPPETVARLRELLDGASAGGAVRYGLHLQDQALVTCVVPSVLTSDHMHFVDGSGGGYASAAQQLRD